MNIILYLFTLLFLGCSKGNDPAPVPVTPPAETLPAQYGTPFTNVPGRGDAIIYQVNTRAFSAGGNFLGVTARLDSIKALGVNVIYLMPMYPVGVQNAFNSPYCIKDYTSIGAEFGTLDDLRTLVDGAHSRGMAVIIDWIANHTSWDHPWITAHRDWYAQNNNGNIISPPGTTWTDVAQLNYNNTAMRLEMIRSMKYWVYAANIDGFRCDYADGPPADFWKQAIDSLKKISTHSLIFLAEGSRTANYIAGFDYNFGFSFFNQLKSIYATGSSVQTIDVLNNTDYINADNFQQVVRYTSNHDVNGSDGTALDLFGGKKGAMAAFIVAAYMKSIPMIYNGQEVGMNERIPFPFTNVKVNWNADPSTTMEYKKLIAFRNNSSTLRKGLMESYSSNDVCAFTKSMGSNKVLVLVNMRNTVVNYTVPQLLQGSWKDGFANNNTSLGASVTLQPYEYKVLVNL